jgi:hypothetical protein
MYNLSSILICSNGVTHDAFELGSGTGIGDTSNISVDVAFRTGNLTFEITNSTTSNFTVELVREFK